MSYYEYASPMHLELKRLGYCILFNPTEQDILMTKLIVNSKYSTLVPFTHRLRETDYRDATKSALRVYAYYINNPAQFAHDPTNIIGSAIRQAYNALMSFLSFIHKENLGNDRIVVRNKVVKQYKEQALSVWLESATKLAYIVKRNTLLQEELGDLNHSDRIHIDFFKQT